MISTIPNKLIHFFRFSVSTKFTSVALVETDNRKIDKCIINYI